MAALKKLTALAVVGGFLASSHAWTQSPRSHSTRAHSIGAGAGGAQLADPHAGGPVSGGDADPVQMPRKPALVHVKHLINPSVADIQNAIAPRTRIDIIGSVNASDGRTLTIEVDDVRLNFKRASTVAWWGSDTWDGFLNISGRRVEVVHLSLEVQGEGRCRGVMLQSPASDVLITKCTFRNTADGFIADGTWERIAVQGTSFLDCGDWISSTVMEGGYGLFIEDDDLYEDHLLLSGITVTLASTSGQHGIRVSQAQNALIQDSSFGANNKRSMWVYGASDMTIQRSIFDHGSVMFGIKPFETLTDRPTNAVRFFDCQINHQSILEPLAIYCGMGTVDFQFGNLDITSTACDRCMLIGWRSDAPSSHITWYDGSLTFNGQQVWGDQWSSISDWSQPERDWLSINPVADTRDEGRESDIDIAFAPHDL